MYSKDFKEKLLHLGSYNGMESLSVFLTLPLVAE